MDQLQPQLLAPGVFFLEFGVGHAYLWDWGDGLTLIDTGLPGSADAILRAVEAIGREPQDLKEIVLTHFHADHTGSAAELVKRTGASAMAHPADAPIMRHETRPLPPSLTELERPLAEALFGDVSNLPGPQPPPVDISREVQDGDTTAGGGTIVGVAGHTPGSIALFLPWLGVLFTGDTLASHDGAPILGPFNIDRLGAIESLRKQARLAFDIACFGHGKPIVGGASRKVLAMVRSL
jgi:glyoxylase-like metal-dependent hydrolase (beta-lactamase superfamily II)